VQLAIPFGLVGLDVGAPAEQLVRDLCFVEQGHGRVTSLSAVRLCEAWASGDCWTYNLALIADQGLQQIHGCGGLDEPPGRQAEWSVVIGFLQYLVQRTAASPSFRVLLVSSDSSCSSSSSLRRRTSSSWCTSLFGRVDVGKDELRSGRPPDQIPRLRPIPRLRRPLRRPLLLLLPPPLLPPLPPLPSRFSFSFATISVSKLIFAPKFQPYSKGAHPIRDYCYRRPFFNLRNNNRIKVANEYQHILNLGPFYC